MIFEIHGTKGNVRWEKNNLNELLVHTGKISDESRYKRINETEILPYDYKWDHKFTQSDSFTLLFYDFLSNTGNAPSLNDGAKCCNIVDSVLKSDKEKRTVTV